VGGGQVYSRGGSGAKAVAEAAVRAGRASEKNHTDSGLYVDASVLLNIRADEHVVTFGVSEEGATLEEANTKVDGMIKAFREGLLKMGFLEKDVFVDYIAQNRIYGYDINGDTAREKVVGYEVKKNVLVHYKNADVLDNLAVEAARHQIFDLVKVDYVLTNLAGAQDRLFQEAVKVVKRKLANRERLLGVRVAQPPQVFAENYASYAPTELYDSYVAAEAEDLMGNIYRDRMTVLRARKPRTYYFNPLYAKLFDSVINPVVREPVVQVTLFLKLRYEPVTTDKRPTLAPKKG
jgi:uncharacterized protein YggE